MKNKWTMPLTVLASVVGVLVVAALAAILVLASGSVSVGDDVKPGLIERTLAPWGRDRSVERHAPRLKNPYAGDPNAIAAGMDHYRENCLLCHGAPGVPLSEVSRGLNPPAPALGREENDVPDGELFWVTKHGIRFTAMPAFGYTHSDQEIWDIVAFLRHLPELTAQEKEILREGSGEEEAHHHREQELLQPSSETSMTRRVGRARDPHPHEARP
jgi:mono/diheme cytochrome c family protein